MPQITIREKDYTQPVANPLEDYRVLLAGFINFDKRNDFLSRADENGVLELNSVNEFKNFVGFVPSDATFYDKDKDISHGPVIKKAYLLKYAKNFIKGFSSAGNKIKWNVKLSELTSIDDVKNNLSSQTFATESDAIIKKISFGEFTDNNVSITLEYLDGETAKSKTFENIPLVDSSVSITSRAKRDSITTAPSRFSFTISDLGSDFILSSLKLNVEYNLHDNVQLKADYTVRKDTTTGSATLEIERGENYLPYLYKAVKLTDGEDLTDVEFYDSLYKYLPLISSDINNTSTDTEVDAEIGDSDIVFELEEENADESTTSASTILSRESYANQMAYELLSLGYPILYKSVGSIVVGETADKSKINVGDILAYASDALTANRKYLDDYIEEAEKDTNEAYNSIELDFNTKEIYDDYAKLDSSDFWSPLSDKAQYNFRFVSNGLLTDNTKANKLIIELASADDKSSNFPTEGLRRRGDVIALCDIDENDYDNRQIPSKIFENIKNDLLNNYYHPTDASGKYLEGVGDIGKYACFLAPYVDIENPYAGRDTDLSWLVSGEGSSYSIDRLPASFYYLSCFIKAFNANFPEWFATAGYTRGISDYNIKGVGAKFGETLINLLEPRSLESDYKPGATNNSLPAAVNVIATVRGQYYLWGNRTAYPLKEELVASHFLNIRQLCTSIKKELYNACRRFTFEPNSDVLWFNFTNAITPLLDRMKANQGLRDYRIVRVQSSKRATLKARIRIVPIEAVEDFDIEVSLEDSLGVTTVTVSE